MVLCGGRSLRALRVWEWGAAGVGVGCCGNARGVGVRE